VDIFFTAATLFRIPRRSLQATSDATVAAVSWTALVATAMTTMAQLTASAVRWSAARCSKLRPSM